MRRQSAAATALSDGDTRPNAKAVSRFACHRSPKAGAHFALPSTSLISSGVPLLRRQAIVDIGQLRGHLHWPSSAWVEFLRKKGDPTVKQVVARLIQADAAAYTCPVRFELLSGVKAEEEADLEQAFAFSHHLPFEREDWRQAALLERQLRAKGHTVPRNDLFVATVAIRAGLAVTCRDTHFDAVRRIVGGRLKVDQV